MECRCGMSKVIKCSYTPLISVSWPLFRSPGLWDKFGKFRFIGKCGYVGMEDLQQEFLAESCSIIVELPENKT